uniref:Retrovirus-related Pol polyprotein from transposon TNT 1-94 n=1 Tax=Cajanus cajan TaxID=3821 RepID=A0A151TQN4_CAJCA|nr:hypothetical protein KK1_008536 [Cajanus cajan]
MASSNGNFPATLPVLEGGKKFDQWCAKMRVIFGFQDVLDIVKEGVQEVDSGATEDQKAANKEAKKKDCKALFIIHQCVDMGNFEKISNVTTAKEAWEILERAHAGNDKLKKVRLQTLRRQYELLQMEGNEVVGAYFTRVLSLTNLMKSYGERISSQMIVEKVLRSLSPRFDHIVVAIEESKNLEILTS